ncbi:MAG TPA: ACT domain-containing protein [Casimicrobiaceae bacterium]|nr:ACT domain-containing protein [Casimicrobiaceae bacterium]
MKITLVGSRYFGAAVLAALSREEVEIVQVVAPAADDRLALAAQKAGIALHLLADTKSVPAEAIPSQTDLIVAAHTHARVSEGALRRSRHGGIGYHPSLLPRHRGIAAVEWTIIERDPIAGGSVYHLSEGWDAGAIAAQDWCFVGKNETARELWERALAPMGLALLAKVVRHVRDHDKLLATPQDERYATRAPLIRRSVTLSDAAAPATTSLMVTVIGADRPGIVRLVSERARGFGANWEASRMTSLRDQFAGIVHFEVPPEHAEALSAALRGLEASGLQVHIVRSDSGPLPPGRRIVRLELAGMDRPGIIDELSSALAERGISIEDLSTDTFEDDTASQHRFKLSALLFVPKTFSDDELRRTLEPLTREMRMDLALG